MTTFSLITHNGFMNYVNTEDQYIGPVVVRRRSVASVRKELLCSFTEFSRPAVGEISVERRDMRCTTGHYYRVYDASGLHIATLRERT